MNKQAHACYLCWEIPLTCTLIYKIILLALFWTFTTGTPGWTYVRSAPLLLKDPHVQRFLSEKLWCGRTCVRPHRSSDYISTQLCWAAREPVAPLTFTVETIQSFLIKEGRRLLLSHSSFKNMYWAREMAQWLKALVTLAEDWQAAPSTCVGCSQSPVTPDTRGSDGLFWSLQESALTFTHHPPTYM